MWYVKSDAEIEHQQRGDEAAGRFFDSAGEPLLYSRLGSMSSQSPQIALVTRVRGLQWPHWGSRPVGLVEGIVTLDGVVRTVMFLKRSVLR